MSDIGHLYVLANSAMPGLVKVGKTTRSPAERAAELSGSTGLPTPFIVVYEQLFADCSSAEEFVHSYLAIKGFRVADNREFFNAPVNEVVRAITMAPNPIQDDTPLSSDSMFLYDAGKTETFQPTSQNPHSLPWESVLAEADRHYLGLDDTLQDHKEALRLYIQAAKLGALPAYGTIGQMYRRGEGTQSDPDRGLAYFKEGARKGSVYCHWALGMVFADPSDPAGLNIPNAEKCFSQFVRCVVDGYRLAQWEANSVLLGCATPLCPIYRNKEISAILREFILEYAECIEGAARSMISHHSGVELVGVREQYESAILYLHNL